MVVRVFQGVQYLQSIQVKVIVGIMQATGIDDQRLGLGNNHIIKRS